MAYLAGVSWGGSLGVVEDKNIFISPFCIIAPRSLLCFPVSMVLHCLFCLENEALFTCEVVSSNASYSYSYTWPSVGDVVHYYDTGAFCLRLLYYCKTRK